MHRTLIDATDSPWARLLLAGALILAAVVLFQGAVTAAVPAAAQPATESAQVDPFDLFSAGWGSRIGLAVDDRALDADGEAGPGAAVQSVLADSPADAAGFGPGDRVVEFDGERIRSARQLARVVRETPAGRPVAAVVLRAGEQLELEVTPEERSSAMRTIRRHMPPIELSHIADLSRLAFNPRYPRLGVEVSDLTPQLAEYFGVEQGVLVTAVEADSPADAAGLRAGDVVLAIDGAAVSDWRTLRRRVTEIDPPAAFTVEIMRDRGVMTLEGRLEAAAAPRRQAL